MIILVVWIAVGTLFAVVCAAMARSRGRDAAVWGLFGFFFAIIPVIVLMIAGSSASQRQISNISPVESLTVRLDEIEKLKQLVDQRVITHEEFEAQKRRLLD